MKFTQRQSGFSLTEVLMAVGILTIGMMLVATMFPLGMRFTSLAAERTIAGIVADEAFAKIQIFGVDVTKTVNNEFKDFNDVSYYAIDANEYSYPSTDPNNTDLSQYYWSAICRKISSEPNDTMVQVIVFVGRKRAAAQKFDVGGTEYDYPMADLLAVNAGPGSDELTISDSSLETYVNPPANIVDDSDGRIYRVIAREDNVIQLDRDFDTTTPPEPENIWIMSRPISGGKNADIDVFQKIIKF